MSDGDDDLAERARARVGQTLCGKYRIEGVLGVGGMAFVYVATHRNGRRVAIKMLHPELSLRADLRKRFLQEAHAANAVNHPGAVVIIDDDVAEDGAAFLVMELLEGQSVEDLWRDNDGVLAPKTALAIGRELCEVLVAAHAVGIIHRDLKPANLFLTKDGRLKVLDFGLARVRDATTGGNATATGLVFGTPAFLPPEQAAGRTSQIDPRTDLWAVGATMFTLLTGRTVHEGESAQNLVVLAATKPPRSLASVLADAPPQLVSLIDRAIAFDQVDRWPDARAMRDAICATSEAIVGEAAPGLAGMSDVIQVVATTPGPETPRRDPEGAWPIGTRTSTPVSSTAPTRPQVPGLHARAFSLLRTAAASIPMSTVAWQKRAALAVVIGVSIALACVAGGVAVYRALRRPQTDAAPANALALDGGSAPERSVELADSKAPAPLEPPDLAAPTADATTPSVAKAALPAHTTGKPTPNAGAAKTWRRMPSRPTAPPTSSAVQPNCTSPSYVDASGKTIWKTECL